jgi:hypothetical protein
MLLGQMAAFGVAGDIQVAGLITGNERLYSIGRNAVCKVMDAPHGAEISDKQAFSETVRTLGYTAPDSMIVRARHISNETLTAVMRLDETNPSRFCKPLISARGRGAHVAPTPDDALDFVAMSRRAYLVQTNEAPTADMRVILHRDVTHLREDSDPGWRVSYEKVRPEVAGNGQDTVADLIEADERIPKKAVRYVENQGEDLGRVPAEGEVVSLINSGNISKGAYSRLLTEAEQQTLDRFMLGFLVRLEAHYGAPLATICFDIGTKKPDTLDGPYDEARLRKEIVFYEAQMLFGMKGYTKHLPAGYGGLILTHMPEDVRQAAHRARVGREFFRSMLLSGLEARRQLKRAA